MIDNKIIQNDPSLIEINENLDTFSVDDIDERINLLQNEITRLEHEKKEKTSSIKDANAIFNN